MPCPVTIAQTGRGGRETRSTDGMRSHRTWTSTCWGHQRTSPGPGTRVPIPRPTSTQELKDPYFEELGEAISMRTGRPSSRISTHNQNRTSSPAVGSVARRGDRPTCVDPPPDEEAPADAS